MTRSEKMLKEEKELEDKLFGTPEAKPTSEADATSELKPTDETPAPQEGLVAPKVEPVQDEVKAPLQEEENWELRFKNLRSSRSENLYKTKSQLAAALETITTLQQDVRKLQAQQPKIDPFEGVFTDEDKEALGDTTVDVMRKATEKATEAATAPLKAQLEQERTARESQTKLTAQQMKQEAYNIMVSRISKAVPDWELVNYDPEFKKYMDLPDLDGTARKTYFTEAESQGNAAQIIRYMQDYKAQAKPVDKLAGKVTPTGEDAGANPPQLEEKEEIMSRAFINQFYDDLNRGKYQGKHSEAQQIEASIDLAHKERRVR